MSLAFNDWAISPAFIFSYSYISAVLEYIILDLLQQRELGIKNTNTCIWWPPPLGTYNIGDLHHWWPPLVTYTIGNLHRWWPPPLVTYTTGDLHHWWPPPLVTSTIGFEKFIYLKYSSCMNLTWMRMIISLPWIIEVIYLTWMLEVILDPCITKKAVYMFKLANWVVLVNKILLL